MNKKLDFLKDLPDGAFVPFFLLFPEENMALKIRKITLMTDMFGLQKGFYFLAENYCPSKTCDCRKVMINVIRVKGDSMNDVDKGTTTLGTVGFGWEALDYYTEWMGGDEEIAKQMMGVYVEGGGIQTGMEKECWSLVNNSLKDPHYVEIIKKRYARVKKLVEEMSFS